MPPACQPCEFWWSVRGMGIVGPMSDGGGIHTCHPSIPTSTPLYTHPRSTWNSSIPMPHPFGIHALWYTQTPGISPACIPPVDRMTETSGNQIKNVELTRNPFASVVAFIVSISCDGPRGKSTDHNVLTSVFFWMPEKHCASLYWSQRTHQCFLLDAGEALCQFVLITTYSPVFSSGCRRSTVPVCTDHNVLTSVFFWMPEKHCASLYWSQRTHQCFLLDAGEALCQFVLITTYSPVFSSGCRRSTAPVCTDHNVLTSVFFWMPEKYCASLYWSQRTHQCFLLDAGEALCQFVLITTYSPVFSSGCRRSTVPVCIDHNVLTSVFFWMPEKHCASLYCRGDSSRITVPPIRALYPSVRYNNTMVIRIYNVTMTTRKLTNL